MAKPGAVRIELGPASFGYAICAIALVWLVLRLWPIAVVLLTSLLFAGTLAPAIAALERRKLRRSVAIAIVFGAMLISLALLGLLLGPPLSRQLFAFADDAPRLQARLAAELARHRITMGLSAPVRRFDPASWLRGSDLDALAYSAAAARFLGYLATSFVLALYFLADRDRSRGALFAVVPRRYHIRLAHVLLKLERIVGGYVRGQLVTSALIAAFSFALLSACRVQGALALAAFAGLTDAIPFVGGLLATVPAVLAAASHGLGTASIVGGALVLYQELESRVIVPRVYGRALRLPAAAVIVALLVGGKLLGIVGALLALPVAAALRMIVYELRVELPGNEGADEAQRARDELEDRDYARRTAGVHPDEAAGIAIAIAAHNDADPAPNR